MDLSLVIPCYNSENTIRAVLDEFLAAVKTRSDVSYEIILVNDSSKDKTWDTIMALAYEIPEITCIDFAKNFGQPSALMAGFAATKGKYVITADDDGQIPISRVFDFWDKLEEGYDVVCAKYNYREQPSLFRKFGTFLNESMAQHILKKPKEVALASFFIARRFVIEAMLEYENAYPYIAGLLLRTTHNIGNLVVEQRDRLAGNSGYSFIKLLRLWMNGFTAFSVIPLRVATLCGGIVSVAGLFFAIMVIVKKLLNPSISEGWSSTISIILIVGGMILLVLGMIGEYIGRIYISLNKSPQYVIRQQYSQKQKSLIEKPKYGNGE